MLRDTVLLISRGATCSSAYQTFVKEIPIYFYYLSKYRMSLFFSHKYKDFKDLTGLNQDCVSGTLADLDSPPIQMAPENRGIHANLGSLRIPRRTAVPQQFLMPYAVSDPGNPADLVILAKPGVMRICDLCGYRGVYADLGILWILGFMLIWEFCISWGLC